MQICSADSLLSQRRAAASLRPGSDLGTAKHSQSTSPFLVNRTQKDPKPLVARALEKKDNCEVRGAFFHLLHCGIQHLNCSTTQLQALGSTWWPCTLKTVTSSPAFLADHISSQARQLLNSPQLDGCKQTGVSTSLMWCLGTCHCPPGQALFYGSREEKP